MNVHELTRKQLVELKFIYLRDKGAESCTLDNSDELVADDVIFEAYANYDFMDFSISNPDTLVIDVTDVDWDIDDDDVMERFGSLRDDNNLPYTAKDFGLHPSIILEMSKARYEDMVEEGDDDDESMEDYIADRLANEYGFCPTNFTWQFVRANTPTEEEEDDTMTISEYLDTDNGRELKQYFDDYFTDAATRGAEWWRCNCAVFAYISEAWIAFNEGLHWNTVEEIDEDFADASPKEIFDGVICWANSSDDAAVVLTCNYPDARDEELDAAWTQYKDM